MTPTFAPGSFFADRYLIEKLLGSGAMGRVYQAIEMHSDRQVALKVLHGERVSEADTVSRFRREAEVLASIGHPCIVEIYTFHQSAEGIPYLAMELLKGVTLKTRLQNGPFQDPGDLQEIIDGLAGALNAAHEHGVVHRDIKPDNIFLPATGVPRAKLVDFGLSRISKPDKSITQRGMIIGTPRYMAPEQIRDASSAGPRGDLYSLGVIIYECLSGKSPYPAEDYGQLLGCVMEGRVTPFQEHRPDLPLFQSFMQKALAHDPAQRFANGGELADAYAAAVGAPSKRHAIAKQVPEKPERSKTRQRISSKSFSLNKSSTLAFDASATREALAALERGPPPEAPDTEPKTVVTASPFAPEEEVVTELYGGHSLTEPMGDQEMAHAAAAMSGPAATGEPLASSAPEPMASIPETPVPIAPGPPPIEAPPPGFQAQGGDTLFLGDASQLPPMPGLPQQPQPSGEPHPSAALSESSTGAAPRERKKRGFGLILFLIAMLIVVFSSAVGGFALRAHMRGDLDIPGLER